MLVCKSYTPYTHHIQVCIYYFHLAIPSTKDIHIYTIMYKGISYMFVNLNYVAEYNITYLLNQPQTHLTKFRPIPLIFIQI